MLREAGRRLKDISRVVALAVDTLAARGGGDCGGGESGEMKYAHVRTREQEREKERQTQIDEAGKMLQEVLGLLATSPRRRGAGGGGAFGGGSWDLLLGRCVFCKTLRQTATR